MLRLAQAIIVCGSAIVALSASVAGADVLPPPTAPAAYDTPGLFDRQAYPKLLDRAKRDGSVRVVVTPIIPGGWLPESILSREVPAEGPPPLGQVITKSPSTRVDDQRSLVRQVQDGLLSRSGIDANKNSVLRWKALRSFAATLSAVELGSLMTDEQVLAIEENITMRGGDSESIPQINADEAWNLGFTGSGWDIAVIDSGVQANHPFLYQNATTPKVSYEACFSTTGGGYTSTCPSGISPAYGPGSAAPCTGATNCDHGTRVAGIAAGKDYSGGPGYSGVAKDSTLIAIKVAKTSSADERFYATYDDAISAFEHVYDLRGSYIIASINFSIGSEDNYNTTYCDSQRPAFTDIVRTLSEAGIASVFISHNWAHRSTDDALIEGIAFPSCISYGISVGAVTEYDGIPDFSQGAAILSVLAPGTSISSSTTGSGYAADSGTSYAAPHVAGAIAVLRQKFALAHPPELRRRLRLTGVPITDSRFAQPFATPRIDVEGALTLFPPATQLINSAME